MTVFMAVFIFAAGAAWAIWSVGGALNKRDAEVIFLRSVVAGIAPLRAALNAERKRADDAAGVVAGTVAAIAAEADAMVAGVRANNDRLLALLAKGKGDCMFCGLPAVDIAKCADGFPGCGRADELMFVAQSEIEADAESRALTAINEADAMRREVERLNALLNSPVNDAWLEGVRVECAHQRIRWHADHDAKKNALDWFWLIGYLAQKVTFAALAGDAEKAKHHTISTGAALLNWHARLGRAAS